MANTVCAPPSAAVSREQIGKYRLLRDLDGNRPGTVYAAEESNANERRALRVQLLPSNPARRDVFLDEARKLMRLDHPHLATVLDAGEADSDFFLVTELPKGETLQDRLKREHCLPMKEALRIAREMAAGLAFAHEHGLVHRDICPANVWLEPTGRARLLGLGAHSGSEPSSLLSRFDDSGTPGYLSPEQAAGEEVAAASDLFSLGCVLYQMTTGERPFRGEGSAALFRAVVFDHPSAARAVNPDVPEAIDELIARLLAKLPADRPATARAVEEKLTEWLDPTGTKAGPTKPHEAIVYPASRRILQSIESMQRSAPTAARPAEIPFATELPVKRSWWADAVAAALLLAGAAGLYLWWRASNEKATPPPPAAQSQPNR
jgi:serine/threonine protein kinase